MEELLTNLLDRSSFPVLSSFILGLLTAISPCPLATNITAVGYISRNIENREGNIDVKSWSGPFAAPRP